MPRVRFLSATLATAVVLVLVALPAAVVHAGQPQKAPRMRIPPTADGPVALLKVSRVGAWLPRPGSLLRLYYQRGAKTPPRVEQRWFGVWRSLSAETFWVGGLELARGLRSAIDLNTVDRKYDFALDRLDRHGWVFRVVEHHLVEYRADHLAELDHGGAAHIGALSPQAPLRQRLDESVLVREPDAPQTARVRDMLLLAAFERPKPQVHSNEVWAEAGAFLLGSFGAVGGTSPSAHDLMIERRVGPGERARVTIGGLHIDLALSAFSEPAEEP